MLPIVCLSKKQDTALFKAESDRGPLFVKAVLKDRADLVEALTDEYETMKDLRRPYIPVYHEFYDRLVWEGKVWSALSMDFVPGKTLSSLSGVLPLSILLDLIARTGECLNDLLSEGIVYTDLNPGNILIDGIPGKGGRLYLIDYTGAWYFKRNPRPSYTIRFSYPLSFEGSSSQLLIRELSMLAEKCTDSMRQISSGQTGSKKEEDNPLPSSFYAMLETGRKPGKNLTLPEFIHMIRK